jgi:DNA-binding transcriptional LysR family regulator
MHKLRNLLGPLRVLDAVYRCGGVGRAADRLHITPGAVSHQLRKLEDELGTKVAARSGRDIELTTIGRDLAIRSADLFDRLESVVADATNAGAARPIRVKIIPSLAIKWLMPRLAGFYALHDAIDLEIATVARVDDTDLDNADFVVRRGRGDWPDLRADRLFGDALVVVCTPTIAARLRKPADVLSEKLLRSIIAPTSWDAWCASIGLHASAPTRTIPLANAALCLQAASEGLGIAVTQDAYVAGDLATGLLVKPFDHVARSDDAYYLVSDPAKAALEPYRHFLTWLLGTV